MAFENISAIILAAGASKRIGRPKQLLSVGGKPAIVHCVHKVLAAGIEDVLVVLGHHATAIRRVLADYPVKFVSNHDLSTGMIGSVQYGISALDKSTQAALICPCDYVVIKAGTITALIRCFKQLEYPAIVRPSYKGVKGHPVIFHRKFFHQIQASSMLRDVVRTNLEMVYDMDVDDEGVIMDMDTWDAYLKIKALHETDSKRDCF